MLEFATWGREVSKVGNRKRGPRGAQGEVLVWELIHTWQVLPLMMNSGMAPAGMLKTDTVPQSAVRAVTVRVSGEWVDSARMSSEKTGTWTRG